MKLHLSESEVNTLIAALMLTAVRYNSPELKKAHPRESEKYKSLEERLRNFCYLEDNTASLTCISTFD